MADLAQIGLRIENGQAVAALGQMDTAFDRTTQKIADSRVKFEAWQRQLANKAAASAAAESTARLNAEIERVNSQTSSATAGIGRLRGSITSLAASALSATPGMTQLGSAVGLLGLGASTTVGVLAGLAAIGFAYNALTENSRLLTEESDKLTKSLLAQRRAFLDTTEAGSKANVTTAAATEAAAFKALDNLRRAGNLDPVAEQRAVRALTDATNARIQAETNLNHVRGEERAAGIRAVFFQEDQLAASAKKAADEDKRAADESKRQHDQRIAQLKAQAAEEERLARLAGEHARQEEERTQRLAKGIADMIRARAAEREEAQKLLSIEIDMDALRKDIGKNVSDALASADAAKKYVEDMKGIWRQGIGKIVTDGTKSFRDFFEDVLQLFTRLMSRMDDEMQRTGNKPGMGYKALGISSAAIAGAFGGYQAGQSIGSTGAGGVFGAASGAASGYAIAGPLGAVVGGLTGLVGGLIGGAAAARAHALALQAAAKQIAATIADLHDLAQGTTGSLESQIRHAHEQFDAARMAATAASSGAGTWWQSPQGIAALAAQLAQLTADEAAYIARLKEEQAIKNRQYAEDLQVRLLRAQGHEAEANRLALQLRQQREYAEAVAAGADAQTLALLKQVQAAEYLKGVIDGLSTTVNNAPSGFKIESYINRFAAPRQGFYPGGGMLPNPFSPQGGPTSPRTSVNIATVNISLPNVTRPSEVGPAVIKYLSGVRDVTLGPNATLADAMELA